MSRPLPATSDSDASRKARAAAMRTIAVEIDGLKALGDALLGPLGESLSAVVELIRDGDRRVVISGMGKSGLIGRKIASTPGISNSLGMRTAWLAPLRNRRTRRPGSGSGVAGGRTRVNLRLSET